MSGAAGPSVPRPAQGSPDWSYRLTQDIVDYIDNLLRAPIALPEYTVARLLLLPAAMYKGKAVICTNETGGRTIATSDGTAWKRVKDGATVS